MSNENENYTPIPRNLREIIARNEGRDTSRFYDQTEEGQTAFPKQVTGPILREQNRKQQQQEFMSKARELNPNLSDTEIAFKLFEAGHGVNKNENYAQFATRIGVESSALNTFLKGAASGLTSDVAGMAGAAVPAIVEGIRNRSLTAAGDAYTRARDNQALQRQIDNEQNPYLGNLGEAVGMGVQGVGLAIANPALFAGTGTLRTAAQAGAAQGLVQSAPRAVENVTRNALQDSGDVAQAVKDSLTETAVNVTTNAALGMLGQAVINRYIGKNQNAQLTRDRITQANDDLSNINRTRSYERLADIDAKTPNSDLVERTLKNEVAERAEFIERRVIDQDKLNNNITTLVRDDPYVGGTRVLNSPVFKNIVEENDAIVLTLRNEQAQIFKNTPLEQMARTHPIELNAMTSKIDDMIKTNQSNFINQSKNLPANELDEMKQLFEQRQNQLLSFKESLPDLVNRSNQLEAELKPHEIFNNNHRAVLAKLNNPGPNNQYNDEAQALVKEMIDTVVTNPGLFTNDVDGFLVSLAKTTDELGMQPTIDYTKLRTEMISRVPAIWQNQFMKHATRSPDKAIMYLQRNSPNELNTFLSTLNRRANLAAAGIDSKSGQHPPIDLFELNKTIPQILRNRSLDDEAKSKAIRQIFDEIRKTGNAGQPLTDVNGRGFDELIMDSANYVKRRIATDTPNKIKNMNNRELLQTYENWVMQKNIGEDRNIMSLPQNPLELPVQQNALLDYVRNRSTDRLQGGTARRAVEDLGMKIQDNTGAQDGLIGRFVNATGGFARRRANEIAYLNSYLAPVKEAIAQPGQTIVDGIGRLQQTIRNVGKEASPVDSLQSPFYLNFDRLNPNLINNPRTNESVRQALSNQGNKDAINKLNSMTPIEVADLVRDRLGPEMFDKLSNAIRRGPGAYQLFWYNTLQNPENRINLGFGGEEAEPENVNKRIIYGRN